MSIDLEGFVRRGHAAQRAVNAELRRHAMKKDYEKIAQVAILAAEKAGGSMLDFVLGLKDISVTVKERMELSIEELSPEEREKLLDES